MEGPKKKGPLLSRRQFVAGAGTFLVLGAVPNWALTAPGAVEKGERRLFQDRPAPEVILHDPALCAGCGVCTLMCAFFREGEYGPDLAGNELHRDPFDGVYTFWVCRHCPDPACYSACPHKDKALCRDTKTGITYVDSAQCQGCGACAEACPFSPPPYSSASSKEKSPKV